MPDKLDYVRLAELLKGFEGRWVAIRGGEVIEAKETADHLIITLRDRGITDALVIRSPEAGEPEMVGLG